MRPKTFSDTIRTQFGRVRRPDRDVFALGIALAAIIMFVGTGGSIMPQIVRAWRGLASQPDLLMTNAVIINIAVILMGWTRYKALRRELQERRISECEARRLADIDPLTGCYNRRSISPALAKQLADARKAGREVSIVLVDLDNFKQVNDLHGHHVGDAVLKISAERIADILSADGLLARLGGDEFACSLPHAADRRAEVDTLVERLIDEVATPIALDDVEVEITMSVGIADTSMIADDDDDSAAPQQLLHQADIAMYHSKKQGKNRYCRFEPSMERELRFRNELESGIRKGIGAGEFVPYYEQQVDLETGSLVGFEMLARWHSPGMGTVGPDTFIPIAEEIGVIAELSENLIAQALHDARQWDPSLTLSVNISPVQLRDPWFAQKLLKLLVEHNFPPSRLEIEVTESCLHENVGLVRTMITSLRNQGVTVSLDDFGTGYASLAQLRTLPFDRLKIDRSFVREVKRSEAGGKLVEAIIAMGNGLKLPITAEGIENGDIVDVLRQTGGLKGQGYHYGMPEPADKVAERLAAASLLAPSDAAGDETDKKVHAQRSG